RNFMRLLEGGTSPVRDEILINVGVAGGALRLGDWKLVVNGHVRDGLEGGQKNPEREEQKRQALRSPVVELFNLRDDHSEKKNLSRARPDIVRELRRRLDQYASEAVPSKQAPPNPEFKVPSVWGPVH